VRAKHRSKQKCHGLSIHNSLPIYLNRQAKILCYWDHKPRLPWQTKEYYASQRRTLRPNTFLRLHENRWTSSESQFIAPEQWDVCINKNHSPILAGAVVHIGVDLGVKSDSSAVVGVCWTEDGKRLMTAFHRI
jgi:phage terminase large subunit-like protein